MKTIYISYEVGGMWYEWSAFHEMLEYYKGYSDDRWSWSIKKVAHQFYGTH